MQAKMGKKCPQNMAEKLLLTMSKFNRQLQRYKTIN